MNVTIIGTGYVGITTAVALGELGHYVTGVDVDKEKIRRLQQGILPIYEPGVESLLHKELEKGTLFFTTSLEEVLDGSEVVFIAVGTPSLPNGFPDMSFVEEAAKEIGRKINSYKIVVNKSTVPVGTAERVKELIVEETKKRNIQVEVDVISNPEFLQEGKALQDARNPDRIVIGSYSEKATRRMLELYEDLKAPILLTTPHNAEMIKYASNAFLATKISFVNEIARLCDKLGLNVNDVTKGMGLDQRIGSKFLQAGVGYGGSCFPKDVAALYSLGKNEHIEMSILRNVQEINRSQTSWFINKMQQVMNGLEGKTIALLGLSFKPETDDIREAPSLRLISKFLELGATVKAYDPIAVRNVKKIFSNIVLTEDVYEAICNADAIVFCTEWKEFDKLDWQKVKSLMKGNHVFDGRNFLDKEQLHALGFVYWGVGRN